MTNEEIVLNKLSSGRLGKTPLKFSIPSRENYNYFDDTFYDNFKFRFDEEIKDFMELKGVNNRILGIIKLSEHYRTYYENGRFQCSANSRRSTVDIWRIYKYYFGDIDIFSIMRALYYVVKCKNVNTYRCPDIRKRVFWKDDYIEKDVIPAAELGVPFKEWENIGL